jgi:hypothetical protein
MACLHSLGPWPSIFAHRDVRCEVAVSVLRSKGHRRAKLAGEIRALHAQDTYAAPSYLFGWSPAIPLNPMGHNLVLRSRTLKTDEQNFRSLHAPGMLVQAPIRAPCSITPHFGADRAEIRPIGAIAWRALPSSSSSSSSPNPSGHFAWRVAHHIDEEVDAKTARHIRASKVPVVRPARGQQASRSHSP